jgi:pilus assembly protein CpaF
MRTPAEQAREIYDAVQIEIAGLPINEFVFSADQENNLRSLKIEQLIQKKTMGLSTDLKNRIEAEFDSWGPLNALFEDEAITEIIVNGPNHIWFEKSGRLNKHRDGFFSDLSYRNFLERLCQKSHVHISIEQPSADGKFLDFRLSLIGSDLTHSSPHLCLRRHPKNPWNFSKLVEIGWCDKEWLPFFEKITRERKNCLIIGSTGSGKTSILNSFLNLLPQSERVVIIEDTPEIALPNEASMKLLTREDPHGILSTIDQSHLVKKSLRLRPDRIVMGEVRGPEAKDFLMVLATGHTGSFGTLHAQDANQALIRLEMLIQMGAPQWSLTAIRRLIQLSLDYIIITERVADGDRRLKGAFRLCSLEDHGFLVEQTGPYLS